MYFAGTMSVPDQFNPLGLDGTEILTSKTGRSLFSITEFSTGTYIQNVSDRPLYLALAVRYRDITKSGFGRPEMVSISSNLGGFSRTTFATKDLDDNKGLQFSFIGVFQPGSYTGIKFSTPVTTLNPAFINVMATADEGTFVKVARPPRDDYDGTDDFVSNTNSKFLYYGLDSYLGGSSGLCFDTLPLPDTFTYTQVQTAQGVRGYLTNNSGVDYICLISGYIGGYTSSFYMDGLFDGNYFPDGNNTRFTYVVDFGQAKHFSFEPSGGGGHIYGNLTFVPRTFDSKWDLGPTQ